MQLHGSYAAQLRFLSEKKDSDAAISTNEHLLDSLKSAPVFHDSRSAAY